MRFASHLSRLNVHSGTYVPYVSGQKTQAGQGRGTRFSLPVVPEGHTRKNHLYNATARTTVLKWLAEMMQQTKSI